MTARTSGRLRANARHMSLYMALAALSCLAILLRYPTGHEKGVDSFFIHGLAEAITSTYSMGWLVSPLSYLGLAPFSYSPAVPTSLAFFSQVAAVDMEPAVLVYSLFLAVVTPWTAFVLGRATTRHNGISVFLAFLITASEGMIGFTDWTVSTRGMFLVLAPLAVALFVKVLVRETRSRAHLQLLVMVTLVLVLVHALWLLLVPSLIAAALAFHFMSREDRLLMRHPRFARGREMLLISSVGLAGLLFILIVTGPNQESTLTGFPQVKSSILPDNLLTRIGLQYGTIMGVGLILLPLGLLRLVTRPDRTTRYAVVALSMVFIPVSLDPVYGVLLSLPVLLLISAMAIAPNRPSAAVTRKLAPTRTIVIVSLVAAMVLAVPPLVTIPRTSGIPCSQTWTLDGQTYDAGLYTRYLMRPETSFAWDNGVEASRIQAISGAAAVEPLASIGTLEYPWLRKRFTPDFVAEPNPSASLINEQQVVAVREWLPDAGTAFNYFWGKHTLVLLQNPLGSPAATQVLDFYQSTFAIEICSGTPTVFFASLHASNYIIYADGIQRIYGL